MGWGRVGGWGKDGKWGREARAFSPCNGEVITPHVFVYVSGCAHALWGAWHHGHHTLPVAHTIRGTQTRPYKQHSDG